MISTKNIDYSAFAMSDFLQDDFFIHSANTPTADSERFWNDFAAHKPQNMEEYRAARLYLQAVQPVVEAAPSEEEKEQMWKNILERNREHRHRRLNFFRFAWATAASIAVFVAVAALWNRTETEQQTLFVGENIDQKIDFSTTNARLIIGNKQTIILKGEKSTVVHHSKQVIVNDETKIEEEETPQTTVNQLIIPYGKRSSITFSDGSRAYVNAGSRVLYPAEFAKNEREIYVEGEVFLEVTKDENRPFIVRTHQMTVNVLGTTFNIKAYANQMQQSVVLVSGKVKIVSDKAGKTILSPNEMFVQENGKSVVSEVNTEKYVSWVRGYYIYESEKMEDVLAQLSRFYGKNITCSPEHKEIRISGKIDLKEDFETVMNNLNLIIL